jgi:hypothetical protein
MGPSNLFDPWIRLYDSIPDEDRRRLPIKQVSFLAVGETEE